MTVTTWNPYGSGVDTTVLLPLPTRLFVKAGTRTTEHAPLIAKIAIDPSQPTAWGAITTQAGFLSGFADVISGVTDLYWDRTNGDRAVPRVWREGNDIYVGMPEMAVRLTQGEAESALADMRAASGI